MSHLLNAFYVAAAIAVYRAIKYWRIVRLQGPPSPSFIFGHTQEISESRSPAELYERWAQQYGSMYEIRGPLGSRRLVICDPRALSHVLALDSWKYSHPPLARLQISSLTGPGNVLVALGEEHSRQRKMLNPLFGPTALRKYASVMYDSAYKVFTSWESELQASATGEIMLDVSEWVNNVSFDIIGLAAFSTDFKSLDGETSDVLTALTAVGHAKPSPTAAKILLLSTAYPSLFKLPLPRSKLVAEMSSAMDAVVDKVIDAAKSKSRELETELVGSALSVLLNAEELSPAQIRMQAKSILLAGFTTTSASVKWALVELSMHPKKQERLREELVSFSTADPSYDDLVSLALPYLDAVVRESLRLHPILSESPRVALEDDVIPLANPIRTASGTVIDKVPVRKGTLLTASLYYTNAAPSIWGADAAEFNPERWLDGPGWDVPVPAAAKAYPGYHHTMVFSDGPRACLGKGFALAELKIVLAVLIRNFVLSPRDGMDTTYDKAMFLGPHPKVAGEIGGRLPMRVRRVE
ncbi:cytochrome P450 [Mycena pura]|uniref:Cytochrome P450 n=1 Tax=Mycena pura TaxID=153505 RepID=A0AAD6V2T5_9AGAR|nr:cytochrome P450 [Mycena pura]KAJ7195839.1 cytochrome P450 [Mycena pura]KAJ7198186.1 cytochrome P450 [Mycena pura]